MLLLTEAILQLRKRAPIFEQRVAGTQSFIPATKEDADIDLPACFVVPMSDTAAGPVGGGASQMVTERFATIVVADNSMNPRHGRGLTAEITLRVCREQLIKALVGWSPLSMQFVTDVQYARSQHLSMNNARIWHQYEWTCGYFISGDPESQDGYKALEKVINGYYPEVDATKVHSLRVNASQNVSINPDDQDTFTEVFRSLTDVNPDWIKYTPHAADPGLTEAVPGDVLFSGVRDVEP